MNDVQNDVLMRQRRMVVECNRGSDGSGGCIWGCVCDLAITLSRSMSLLLCDSARVHASFKHRHMVPSRYTRQKRECAWVWTCGIRFEREITYTSMHTHISIYVHIYVFAQDKTVDTGLKGVTLEAFTKIEEDHKAKTGFTVKNNDLDCM